MTFNIVFVLTALSSLLYFCRRPQSLYKYLPRREIFQDIQHKRDVKPSKSDRGIKSSPQSTQATTDDNKLDHYRLMYYKLHNLEFYPSVIPNARAELISLFAEGIQKGKLKDGGLLEMSHYDPESVKQFIQKENNRIRQRYEKYIKRREKGGPRELLTTTEEAKTWLIQRAPSKYVDGAWLGHIHRASTPFVLRSITKNVWQVLSEELGDGDLSKNHAEVYRKLMHSIDAHIPDADSREFVSPTLGLNDIGIWKSAIAQLLISLFPHDFLPEILGFNMHFECLTWDTLLAAKELREMNIDASYFLLHISIDNSDSGHTAMATRIVLDYLQHVSKLEGDQAAQSAWRRVQVGYSLSAMFIEKQEDIIPPSQNIYSTELKRIFRAKSTVSDKLHCGSKVRFGGKLLHEWLNPETLSSDAEADRFLRVLSSSKPWVYMEDSSKSRLVKELKWNGKMFGAFTEDELLVLEHWIDACKQSAVEPATYWNFIGGKDPCSRDEFCNLDTRVHYPVISSQRISEDYENTPDSTMITTQTLPRFLTRQPVNLDKFLPIWFAHISLLEGFVSVPFKTCTTMACAIVAILRAQYGFRKETDGVAGMDELQRTRCTGLIEIGIDMMRDAGKPIPQGLRDVISDGPDGRFALDMLNLSMSPARNCDLLLGMACAFTGLHDSLAAEPDGTLPLSGENLGMIRCIAERERAGLEICLREVKRCRDRRVNFSEGVRIAKREIEACFQ
ncbi:hypothetical protein M501DRAFT_995390 [Patellaria atrata CBS 101060]|uniref:Uncharacterized protein n=1 Tax=Patellaria atrata CBS 101060 TaxID=1346257 RepID=A0A9P4VQ61_9PEZI|nr:hypothetical protein M501DRAFT_995390 [Patellaria atrata CBS 101060]